MSNPVSPSCLFTPPGILRSIVSSEDANESLSHAARRALSETPALHRVVEAVNDLNTTIEKDGSEALSRSKKPSARLVYDLQHRKQWSPSPGILVRAEPDPALKITGKPAPDQCFDNMGIVYTFFQEVFKETIYSNQTNLLVGLVHYDFHYPGAFWLGPSETKSKHLVIFGDGWLNDAFNLGAPIASFGGIFGNFVGSLEVVSHELTHGYIQSRYQLDRHGQPGALNEHLADVFAMMCKHWHLNQTVDQADWLIGEDLVAPKWKGVALRSMKAPGTAYDLSKEGIGKDEQVSHWDHFVSSTADNGGVHANSGILNKGFYLVAMGLGGHSWGKAGKIWHRALQEKNFVASTEFSMWAQLTMVATKRLLKETSTSFTAADVKVVIESWAKVGLHVG
jgi:Zn-dependent metalloprotease